MITCINWANIYYTYYYEAGFLQYSLLQTQFILFALGCNLLEPPFPAATIFGTVNLESSNLTANEFQFKQLYKFGIRTNLVTLGKIVLCL